MKKFEFRMLIPTGDEIKKFLDSLSRILIVMSSIFLAPAWIYKIGLHDLNSIQGYFDVYTLHLFVFGIQLFLILTINRADRKKVGIIKWFFIVPSVIFGLLIFIGSLIIVFNKWPEGRTEVILRKTSIILFLLITFLALVFLVYALVKIYNFSKEKRFYKESLALYTKRATENFLLDIFRTISLTSDPLQKDVHLKILETKRIEEFRAFLASPANVIDKTNLGYLLSIWESKDYPLLGENVEFTIIRDFKDVSLLLLSGLYAEADPYRGLLKSSWKRVLPEVQESIFLHFPSNHVWWMNQEGFLEEGQLVKEILRRGEIFSLKDFLNKEKFMQLLNQGHITQCLEVVKDWATFLGVELNTAESKVTYGSKPEALVGIIVSDMEMAIVDNPRLIERNKVVAKRLISFFDLAKGYKKGFKKLKKQRDVLENYCKYGSPF